MIKHRFRNMGRRKEEEFVVVYKKKETERRDTDVGRKKVFVLRKERGRMNTNLEGKEDDKKE